MSASEPKHDAGESLELEASAGESIFAPELRAALRRELGPDAASRARVRNALLSSVAAGTLSPAAQRVDASFHGHGAGALGSKAAVSASVHSLTAKLVLIGVLVAGGSSAVLMRGPSAHQRAAVEGTGATHKPAAQPVAVRNTPEQADGPAPVAEPQPAERIATSAGSMPPPSAAKPPVHDKRRTPPTPKPAAAPAQNTPAASGGEPARAPAPASSGAQPASTEAGASQLSAASHDQTASPHVEPAAVIPELAAELALVRAASDALQRGDAEQALAQLQRHATRFPQGALRVEVEALRAITLCSSGAASAAAVSSTFLKQHAGSPLAERVRRACKH